MEMFMRNAVVLIVLVGLVSPAVASAQTQAIATSFDQLRVLVRPGNTVTVTDSAGAETRGKVLSVSGASLELSVAGTPRSWAESQVRIVSQQRHSFGAGARHGFFIGAGVGGVLGGGSSGRVRRFGWGDCRLCTHERRGLWSHGCRHWRRCQCPASWISCRLCRPTHLPDHTRGVASSPGATEGRGVIAGVLNAGPRAVVTLDIGSQRHRR